MIFMQKISRTYFRTEEAEMKKRDSKHERLQIVLSLANVNIFKCPSNFGDIIILIDLNLTAIQHAYFHQGLSTCIYESK